ncbi:MAG: AAA family ATPase [Dorea sp.]|nr:AAA family ATPase [Dorea sp.]
MSKKQETINKQMHNEKSDTENKNLPGTSRQEEEAYLADMVMVTQRNLERATENIQKLTGDLDTLREDVEESGEKDLLVLLNTAAAQHKEALRDLSRFEKARKKPYFGRIDFADGKTGKEEAYYIGRVGVSRTPSEPVVIDWRTPVASIYYENNMGRGTYTVSSEGTFEVDLKRKRNYEIAHDRLQEFYDLDVVANDDLLTKYLSKNKSEVLGEIIATIQKEQNRIIRRSPKNNIIVQGVAGSGKTTVAMHRISYILFNYADDFRPEDFYVIGSNEILLNYITSVLPELDVYGVRQMTMEQLFIRLLYEDWNKEKYSCHTVDKRDIQNAVKGSKKWFQDLEAFCSRYEESQIPDTDVYLDKTDILLLDGERIRTFIKERPRMSMQSKRFGLNELLYARYENVILGKHISFTPDEKKAMERKYKNYYARNEWKGSIFDLYMDFLQYQEYEEGYDLDYSKMTDEPLPMFDAEKMKGRKLSFDVYDLAALAYLYKRIKEIDPIREASHVVIDEAQDFGMMAYHCLDYCLRGCTYTIMGDSSQNIHFQYGLNDWNELRQLILPNQGDAFRLLKKSYRNTVEISQFATEILRHGDFSIYPVEPILRHGNPVEIKYCKGQASLTKKTISTIKEWQKSGYETIAVICRDEEEAAALSKKLSQYIEIKNPDPATAEFGNGVMVLSVAYTKGLEFDAVLVYDPTIEKYPADNGHVKMLYVTATRALHELSVVHGENLTPLIAEKAPENKHLEAFEEEQAIEEEIQREDAKKNVPTEREIIEQRRYYGAIEMEARHKIGPKRIVAEPLKKEPPVVAERSRVLGEHVSSSRKLAEKEAVLRAREEKAKEPTLKERIEAAIAAREAERLAEQSAGSKPDEHGRIYNGRKTAEIPRYQKSEEIDPETSVAKKLTDRKEEQDARPVNPSNFKFADMPEDRALSIKGHSRPNCAVRWAKKTKTGMEITSSYGVLTITPVSEACVRITFTKGVAGNNRDSFWKPEVEKGLKWTAKESPRALEVATKRLIVHIEKKDGAIRFLSPDRKVILSEKITEPRLVEGGETWSFFELDKKEKFKIKGLLTTDLRDVSLKCRYFSFGAKKLRMPMLLSSKGYAIGVASEKTAMYCGIPMHGQYIYTEGDGKIDYFFMYGGNHENNFRIYAKLEGRG